jgi:MFS family permease
LIFGFQPPLIALVLSRAGASSFEIGAVTAASLIAVMLLGPFYPLLIARLGLKACVSWGLGCAAVILVLMPVRQSVGFWWALRFLTGCALGSSWIASEVWLNVSSGAARRGTVMGLYGTVFSAGTMLGPAVLAVTGTAGWRPFAVGALCLALTLLPVALLREVPRVAPPVMTWRGLGGLLRAMPVVMLAAAMAGLIESAELTLLPLLSINAGFRDREALLLLTVFMAGNVVLQAPIGVLADRFGRRLMLGVCAGLSAIGPAWLNVAWSKPLLLWPLLFIWGGTLYAFYSQGVALLGDGFTEKDLAAANTLFVMLYCFGGVLGPSVGGIMMDVWPTFGLQALLSGAAVLLLAALAPGIWRGRRPTAYNRRLDQ